MALPSWVWCVRVAIVVQHGAQHTTLHSTAQHTCGLNTQHHSRYSAYTQHCASTNGGQLGQKQYKSPCQAWCVIINWCNLFKVRLDLITGFGNKFCIFLYLHLCSIPVTCCITVYTAVLHWLLLLQLYTASPYGEILQKML